jgi:CubicO group peptidase (beta-lactamase class C family)
MTTLEERIARTATETSFSGVVRVDREGETLAAVAHGLANRPEAVPNTLGTRFGIASGTKGMTALAVMSLVVDGVLQEGTTARSLLGDDLPLVDDGVTVEHLLAHTSGIGDYIDESTDLDITAYLLGVPVHRLATAEDYLAVLDGYPTVFGPGERFRYCNGGYVVLALLAERASGVPYHDLVAQRVCEPAGMTGAVFARSDDVPTGTAVGYLGTDSDRTNVLHLPLRGVGDGGLHCTVADLAAFWQALFAGRVVPPERVSQMVAPRSEDPDEDMRYGLGFWLDRTGDAVLLEGYDPGISFRSCHDPTSGTTWTVVSNTSEGAWPVARQVAAAVADLVS